MAGTVLVALLTYMLMLWAFLHPKRRAVHVPVMVSVMLFDLAMPVYLYLTKDWHRRLIVEGELTSFLLWTHFLLVTMLYTIYVMQIKTALRLLRQDDSARAEHHAQGQAVLLVRAFVILTGALLVEVPHPPL